MLGFIGIIAVLAVLLLSLIITRLATVALIQTGMSTESARFQARSAFTGTGFTTREAEDVVNHPARRRIIMWLMVVRSAGVVSILISLILSFGASGSSSEKLWRLAMLAGGLFGLWLMSISSWFNRRVAGWMSRLLRRYSDLDTRDYFSLLNLSDQYAVREVPIEEGDWAAGQSLRDMKLMEEGVLILGIYRDDGSYVGAPGPATEIEVGDTLVVYGRSDRVREIDRRRSNAAGDRAHEEAVADQERELDKQERHERERKSG